MAINKYSLGLKRNLIGFCGSNLPGNVEHLLEMMGYKCKLFDDSYYEQQTKLALTDSVIFVQDPDDPYNTITDIEHYANKLLNNGCQIYVIPSPVIPGKKSDVLRRKLIRALNRLQLPPSQLGSDYYALIDNWYEGPSPYPLAPFVHVIDTPNDWAHIASTIRNNPAGTAPKLELEITTINVDSSIQLSEEDELLIRRAFHECSTVRFVELSNGLSGVKTFRAYARRTDTPTGSQHPYLYFAKLGPRKLITTEYRKYQDHALQYIPFHLGPRLVMERCSLGQSQGILVCDYVHGAEPLRDCAREGRAAPAISNLFNTTISPWHRNAVTDECSLKQRLDDKFPRTIPRHRRFRIKKFGAKQSPIKLRELIEDRVEPVKLGIVHGDLHATNVLVRSNDAIIIDFEKVSTGFPLVFDAASVEAGLFVDGFIRDNRTPAQLLDSIGCMYTIDAFDESHPLCQAGDSSEWFFDCVRQIRMHARELEAAPRQYARALAVVLLKKACSNINFSNKKKAEGLSREDVRALAYILGERLLVSLTT